MTFFSRIILFLFTLCFFIFVTALIVEAEEGNKYGQWQSADDRLENIINDLDLIIDEGTKSRAAHPGFLQDLRSIIDQYRVPKKLVFFADDFADFNFTENPTWIVSQGTFSIDSNDSLHSSISVNKPTTEQETEPKSKEERNMRLLFGVLNELTKEQGQGEEKETRAIISSAASIANSFNLEFSFRSNSDWGSTSIGVIQDDNPHSGYHLVYQASPSENRPMQLIKYRYGKQYIIDEVHENSPNLDDGSEHVIRLTRAPNGDMVIAVDGLELIRAADLSYQDDFTGVMIINDGGSYSYDNIEFYIKQ